MFMDVLTIEFCAYNHHSSTYSVSNIFVHLSKHAHNKYISLLTREILDVSKELPASVIAKSLLEVNKRTHKSNHGLTKSLCVPSVESAI